MNNSIQQGIQLIQNHRLEDADKYFRKILKKYPKQPDALHLLGVVCAQLGKKSKAVKLITKAIKFNPTAGIYHRNLGLILSETGNKNKAIFCLKKAILLDDKDAQSHNDLGVLYSSSGRVDDAIKEFQHSVDKDPRNFLAYTNLGDHLLLIGDVKLSVDSFKSAIQLNPRFADAYNGLGNAYRLLGKWDEAAAYYNKAIEVDPKHKDAYNSLGNLLREQQKTIEAIKLYRQAIEIDPQHKDAYNGLGNALRETGEIKKAVSMYMRAIEIDPNNDVAYNNLGNSLSDQGDINGAIAAYYKSIEINPEYAEAYRHLANVKKYAEDDPDIRLIESLYMKNGVSDEQRMHLCFALGKIYEDIGEYYRSMDFIQNGNQLKRSLIDYSKSEEQFLFDEIIETFSKRLFSHYDDSGCLNDTPIFILGMPRSGTSLVEQIIASHPLVYGGGELNNLPKLEKNICSDLADSSYPRCVESLDMSVIYNIGEEYIDSIRKNTMIERFVTDKMPLNFLRIGLIKLILPNAKIIHCMRDPMDNCLSIYKNYFPRSYKWSYDMSELGGYYKSYLKIMEHWRDVLPECFYDVSYERLVSDQYEETKKMLDYCDLQWSDSCLSFHKTKRVVGTASNAQVRNPIYNDSVNLWRKYEKELEPLRAAIYD